MLGFDDGMENLHYLLESAFCPGANGDELSLPFLRALENSQSFETHPIFAVLHEMCYTQGAAGALVSGARARRVSRHGLGTRPAAVVHRRDDLSVDVRGLSRTAAAARGGRTARARRNAGRRLYDPAQLARNTVPSVAAGFTPKTCTFRARCRSRRPRRLPASRSGSPTNTSTMGCAAATRCSSGCWHCGGTKCDKRIRHGRSLVSFNASSIACSSVNERPSRQARSKAASSCRAARTAATRRS